MSSFGRWLSSDGSPAFSYEADHLSDPRAEWDPITAPRTRLHWIALGNQRVQLIALNDATCGLYEESNGQRWVTAPDPSGTGISIIEAQETQWSTLNAPERLFGPTFFRAGRGDGSCHVERTVLCPEGDAAWVLVRVRLRGEGSFVHVEEWALRPRFCNLGGSPESRRRDAEDRVRFTLEETVRGLRAIEERAPDSSDGGAFPQVFGPPRTIVLEALGDTEGQPAPTPAASGSAHPVLRLRTPVDLDGERELWFRFGLDDGEAPADPRSLYEDSFDRVAKRLPRAAATRAPEATREIPWHAALLTGGACRDDVFGGHTLNQSSAYAFVVGFNGAARDPLQHALPLVYSEPELALSVLRNTCEWAGPDGDLPYALDGAKQPWTALFQPSDQNLWAMWLAAEYAAATGDLAAFAAPMERSQVTLGENLLRQLSFFIDGVGRGEHGHVRMRNADWNDMAVVDSGVDRAAMVAKGESVLNSAMAAWVLPTFAGLCDRLGEGASAEGARSLAGELRDAVADEWNGRWFRRAYAPGRGAVGEDELWLEVQPWAILCGACDAERSRDLLRTIDERCRRSSPLGARVRHPVRDTPAGTGAGTNGGIWYSINMTLVWAAARVDPDLGWNEWRRMSLAAHAAAYPDVWEGTLSGPDAYNAPESSRAGRTWGSEDWGIAMQAFPVNNLHSHAQPLLAYLRLLGVEPGPDGSLAIGNGGGTGGAFTSATFHVGAEGGGWLDAKGPVVVRSPASEYSGGPGRVEWT